MSEPILLSCLWDGELGNGDDVDAALASLEREPELRARCCRTALLRHVLRGGLLHCLDLELAERVRGRLSALVGPAPAAGLSASAPAPAGDAGWRPAL